MDVFEALQELQHKETAVETVRRPLAPAERNNNNGVITSRRTRTRTRDAVVVVSSRYKSPTPSPSNPRRCPSPTPTTRTINSLSSSVSSSSSSSSSSSHQLAPKRAVSADRRRPSTPPSPVRPSTPVSDTSVSDSPSSSSSSKKMTGGGGGGGGGIRLPEVLWPSTMRSLSVSFQSDSISIPVSKKEKEKAATDNRTLKPSSNVAQTGGGGGGVCGGAGTPRKSTPERKRSPLKGKNWENSRPVDGAQARLIDQHRWPSRTGGGKLSSSSMMAKSVDLSSDNNIGRNAIGGISLRRLSAEGIPRSLQKASSDAAGQLAFDEDNGVRARRMNSVDDILVRVSAVRRADALSSSERASLGATPSSVRSGSLPGSRLPSPSRASSSKATPSPSRTRPSTPIQSRGASPSRIRPSSPTRQSTSTASVLSFIADIKKGKKNNQLEDAHQLRLLYNRYVQWRFTNARADAAMLMQKITAEETLYNVWETNLELWNSVVMKQIELQRLKLVLKLNLVLQEQIGYLEDWALLESDHSTSLGGVIKDLEASTLRLPVTGGAKADIESLKGAMSSALDLMQAMGSSIYSVLSKVEGINGLVSELAEVAGQERAMLNECDALLSSTAAMQVSEYSLQTQLIQSRQDLSRKMRHPLLWTT